MTFYFHVHRQGRTITKSFGRTRDRVPKQAAGVAYFNEQGELLLCKRRTGITDHPGEWAFPAGGVEPGESAAAAARREFKEELDHSLPSLAQQPAVEHGSFTAYVYWGESFTPDLDHEHTECGWFHTEYLPEPTHPGVVAVLEAMPTVVLAHLLSERAATQDADFKEDEHPRDGDGKFTAGAGGGSSSAKPTKATAKGSKAGVHELLSSGHPFTVEELMEATGSTNRVTITTALSDLKNPKYAGALGHLAITKRTDGMYHVEKRYGGGTMARAKTKEPTTPPTPYTGPAYHMVESLDDHKHAVVKYPGKVRLGTYPSFEMADRVRKGHDERAIKEHVKAQKDQPKAPEWKKSASDIFHRATLASGHTASKADHPNGDVTYTVRGGGSTYVHNIKTDSEGTVLHHRVEMPTTIQTVKGPAPGTTQKGLNPNQAAKHAGVYKELGLVPWHKQEERRAAAEAEEDAKIKKQVEQSRGYQENRGYTKMERSVRDLPDSTPSERSLRDQIDYIVDSARVNANDTVDVEKAAKPEEWHEIFEGTLVSILSDTRDPPPRLLEWFASHGVKP